MQTPALHRSVCVFCGSLPGQRPEFLRAAGELGAGLAARGRELVYGGSRDGCMGALADAARARGGRVVGIVPSTLHVSEARHEGLSELLIVPDLAARKVEMFRRSDAVLVLPGGTGTLDEFLEAITTKRVGSLPHPIGLIDVERFFEPLLGLLDHLVSAGFADASQRKLFEVLPDVPAALAWLERP